MQYELLENSALKVTGVTMAAMEDITSYTTAKGDVWLTRKFTVLDNSNPTYPNYITFEISNRDDAEHNNAENVKYNQIGDEVEVSFRLKGRQYTKDGATRYFGSNNAFMVRKAEQATVTIVDADVPVDDGCP